MTITTKQERDFRTTLEDYCIPAVTAAKLLTDLGLATTQEVEAEITLEITLTTRAMAKDVYTLGYTSETDIINHIELALEHYAAHSFFNVDALATSVTINE